MLDTPLSAQCQGNRPGKNDRQKTACSLINRDPLYVTISKYRQADCHRQQYPRHDPPRRQLYPSERENRREKRGRPERPIHQEQVRHRQPRNIGYGNPGTQEQ